GVGRLRIFYHDGALVDDQGGHGLVGIRGAEDAGQVPGAVGSAMYGEPRPEQLDLADDQFAAEELVLVVVTDGGGDVEEVGVVGVGTARQVQVGEGDAAEQAQMGPFEADVGGDELLAQLFHDQAASGGGVGPALVNDAGGSQPGHDDEHD